MNRALRGAYLKGLRARLAGEPCVDPYQDKRKWDGRLTWSRAFSSAWRDGWQDADRDREQALITAQYSRSMPWPPTTRAQSTAKPADPTASGD